MVSSDSKPAKARDPKTQNCTWFSPRDPFTLIFPQFFLLFKRGDKIFLYGCLVNPKPIVSKLMHGT